jgi:hypothetical protein
MEKMKAVQVPKAGADFEIVEREIPQPGAEQVRIHVPQVGFPPAIGWSLLARFSVLIQSTALKISP